MTSKALPISSTWEWARERGVIEALNSRWSSALRSFGLRRDLHIPFAAPQASIPITVRLLEERDIPSILDIDAPGIGDEEREERKTRLQMLRAGLMTCYVAVTNDDRPCYMQWLIGPEQNDKIQTYFKGIFPGLEPGEALLEGAFTPEAYRGKRIMPCAMAQIAEKAAGLGARWAMTFVTQDNIPSLKGCQRSGFVPYMTREEKWHAFRHHVSFTPLPEGTPYPFD
ncbi:MAG TPA: N-acetyltransferase [Chloroflexia bacterium]|nr:N-acetyltransferase [Chloroflexia bacterium]